MKDETIIKRDRLTEWSLAVVALLFWVFWAWHLPYGFRACSDEAFYLFMLDPDRPLGVLGTGSGYIIQAICKLIPGTIINLRIMAYVLVLVSVIFLSLSTIYWLRKKYETVVSSRMIFSVFLLLGAQIFVGLMYTMSLHYNQLQTFFTLSMLSLYLIADAGGRKTGILSVFLMGFFSFLSVINVLPSGLLISFCFVLLLLIRCGKDIRKSLLSLLYFACGIFLSLLFFHVLVKSVFELFADFYSVATTVSYSESTSLSDAASLAQDHSDGRVAGVGVGYSLLNFVVLIQLHLKELLYLSFFSAFLVALFRKISNHSSNRIVAVVLFVLLAILSLVERRAAISGVFIIPVIYACINSGYIEARVGDKKTFAILVAVLLIPLLMGLPFDLKRTFFYLILFVSALFILFKYHKNIFKFIFEKDTLFLLFLFLFPTIASVGTNVPFIGKATFFLPVWGVMFCLFLFKSNPAARRTSLWLFLLISVSFHVFTYMQKGVDFGTFYDSRSTTVLEPMRTVKIRESEKQYIEGIHRILMENGFQNKDKIYGNNANMYAIYAVSGSYCVDIRKARYLILTNEEKHSLAGADCHLPPDSHVYEIKDVNGDPVFIYCLLGR